MICYYTGKIYLGCIAYLKVRYSIIFYSIVWMASYVKAYYMMILQCRKNVLKPAILTTGKEVC